MFYFRRQNQFSQFIPKFDLVLQMLIVFSIRMATENSHGLVQSSKALVLGPGVPIEPK